MTAPAPDPGAGRVVVALYTFFALAAGARAVVQLATTPGRAPLAYGLSAFAAAVYLTGAVVMRRPQLHRLAVGLCLLELAGVVTVGTLSLAYRAGFPEPSVWSDYGIGYGFVPALLPLFALWWLTRPVRQVPRA